MLYIQQSHLIPTKCTHKCKNPHKNKKSRGTEKQKYSIKKLMGDQKENWLVIKVWLTEKKIRVIQKRINLCADKT